MGKNVILNLKGTGRPTKAATDLKRVGFYRFGLEFFAAHQALNKFGSSPVNLFLLGHAIELFLKFYLLTRGATYEHLKGKLIHNLEKTLNECKQNGIEKILPVSPKLEKELKAFNALYNKKSLEYFSLAAVFIDFSTVKVDGLHTFATDLKNKLAELAGSNVEPHSK